MSKCLSDDCADFISLRRLHTHPFRLNLNFHFNVFTWRVPDYAYDVPTFFPQKLINYI